MKKLPVFTVALALSFLIYALYKKSKQSDENLQDSIVSEPHSHHLTDVFAKAKKVATSEQTEGEEAIL